MKRLLIAAFAAVVGLGMMVPEAEAKRLGGGKSFGMQRQATPAPTAPSAAGKPAAAPTAGAPAAAAKPAGMSRVFFSAIDQISRIRMSLLSKGALSTCMMNT